MNGEVIFQASDSSLTKELHGYSQVSRTNRVKRNHKSSN